MPAAFLLSRRLSSSMASTSGMHCDAANAADSPARAVMRSSSNNRNNENDTTTTTLCRRNRHFLGTSGCLRALRRGPLPPQAVKKTFNSFDDMIKESPVPVLVDFHATWCGPCKVMAQNVAACAESMRGSVKVVKVDTDAYPALATRFDVRALPTLLLFVDGVAIDRVEGVLSGPQLTERVRYYSKRLDKKFGRR